MPAFRLLGLNNCGCASSDAAVGIGVLALHHLLVAQQGSTYVLPAVGPTRQVPRRCRVGAGWRPAGLPPVAGSLDDAGIVVSHQVTHRLFGGNASQVVEKFFGFFPQGERGRKKRERCSRSATRLTHQSSSYCPVRPGSGWPAPGRSSNSPRSCASRIWRSTHVSNRSPGGLRSVTASIVPRGLRRRFVDPAIPVRAAVELQAVTQIVATYLSGPSSTVPVPVHGARYSRCPDEGLRRANIQIACAPHSALLRPPPPALSVVAPSATAAEPTVPFISEFHYDNTGTDAGEFVEVQVPPGTSTTGWSIVLYNGPAVSLMTPTALPSRQPTRRGPVCRRRDRLPGQRRCRTASPDGIALVDATATAWWSSCPTKGRSPGSAGRRDGRDERRHRRRPSNGTAARVVSLSKRLGPATGNYEWQPEAPNSKGAVNPPWRPLTSSRATSHATTKSGTSRAAAPARRSPASR